MAAFQKLVPDAHHFDQLKFVSRRHLNEHSFSCPLTMILSVSSASSLSLLLDISFHVGTAEAAPLGKQDLTQLHVFKAIIPFVGSCCFHTFPRDSCEVCNLFEWVWHESQTSLERFLDESQQRSAFFGRRHELRVSFGLFVLSVENRPRRTSVYHSKIFSTTEVEFLDQFPVHMVHAR